MASLSPAEMLKYEWRVEVFVKKLQEHTPFVLNNKQKVKLVYVPAQAEILQKRNRQQLRDLMFVGEDGKNYKLSDFLKNEEFGGKGEGSGTAKEDRELESLKKQLEEIKVEERSASVSIKIGNKTYEAFTAETTPGTPKSDFHLVDVNGEEIVWISHKDGRTAKDFQQWGGMTTKERPVHSHRETQDFIKSVQQMYPDGIPRATTVAREIKDLRLQHLTVYGIDYGKQLGRQNVTMLIQGPVKLVKRGNYYIFQSNHVHTNGEVMTGDFKPVMMAIYKGDRSNFGVNGARFAIQPKGSRKVTAWI